jgi:hypothetical protein
LKTGKNKGKQCSLGVYSQHLCKRHFSLQTKKEETV